MRRQTLILIGVSVVVLAIAMAFSIVMTPERDERVKPTSFSTSPSGTRAIYETLRQAGIDARRWRRPYEQLPDDAILIMAGPEQPISELTWRKVLQPWVVEGGTLVLATGAGMPFHMNWLGDVNIARELQYNNAQRDWRDRDERGDEAAADASEANEPNRESLADEFRMLSQRLAESSDVHAVADTPITPSQTALAVEPGFGLVCDYPAAIPLFADDDRTYAWYIPMHRGRVILTATPGWLANRRIGESDNLRFLLGIIDAYGRGASVLFDERAHGYAVGDRQVSDLWRTPAWGIALAQMLVLLLWYGLSNARRFGPRRLLSRETPRSTMEFVDAMGNLYRRADMRREALQAEWRRFRVDVARRYGVDPRDRPRQLVDRLATVNPASAYTAEASVRTVGEALRRTRLDDKELVRACRALAELRSEVL